MSRRIDAAKLAAPELLEFDEVGGDYHVRLGPTAGDPFTFVTAQEAAEIGKAWTALAVRLGESDGNGAGVERER